MVDWTLAERVAGLVTGEPPEAGPAPDLPALAAEAEGRVAAYTGLELSRPLPPPEALDRRSWVRANVSSVRTILDPVAAKLQSGGNSLGPLAGVLGRAGGAIIAAEVGFVLGVAAQRVMGQYDVALLDPERPPRLLYVLPNVGEAARSLEADPEELARWITLHELTHAFQFQGVAWLQPHLAGLIGELLAATTVKVNPMAALRLPGRHDLERLVEAVRGGDLLSIVTGPEERAIIDRIQAAMTVVEGYAEHVMDRAAPDLVPSVPALREALARRRENVSPIMRLLQRLIGLDVKLAQYRVGKAFCDAVVEREGMDALNRVWRGPETLPTAAELDDPGAWLARTRVPTLTK